MRLSKQKGEIGNGILRIFPTILVLFSSLLFLPISHAQSPAISSTTVNLSNQTILMIFDRISALRGQYRELELFDEKALFRNEYGIYFIDYTYLYEPASGLTEREPFRFAATIVPLETKPEFPQDYKIFKFEFPILGVKLVGFYNRYLLEKEFSIREVAEEVGILLADEQQKDMPLQLSISFEDPQRLDGNQLEVTVKLFNATKKNILVKELNEATVFFTFDSRTVFTKNYSFGDYKKAHNVKLRANTSLTRKFKLNLPRTRHELDIRAFYALTHRKVHPSATIRLRLE